MQPVYGRAVGRIHFVELHELPWFPTVWRDLLTDFLSFYATAFEPYARVAPLLAEALGRCETTTIVDLCSGAGRPLLSLIPALRRAGVRDLEVVLTDKYPNLKALDRLGETGAVVTYLDNPVDATDVPPELSGFRCLFTSFHHFRPAAAREVLASAMRSRQGVGIFEYTERNWLVWAIPTMLIPFFVWACTPFIRPTGWRRLVWTYLIPVVPLVAAWDGFVSNLRTYSVGEIGDLVAAVDDGRYDWQIGRVRSLGASRVTYAIGVPRVTVSSSA